MQSNFNFTNKINIRELFIENNFQVKEKVIKEKLSFLYDTNLLFLNKEDLEKKLNEIKVVREQYETQLEEEREVATPI